MNISSLSDWFIGLSIIRKLYQEELNRDVINDPVATTNWLYHYVNGKSEDWMRAAIRTSDEWKSIHSSPIIDVPSSSDHTVIRVTNIDDGIIIPRMYSYWSNAFIKDGFAYVFCGIENSDPSFYKVNLSTKLVERLNITLIYRGTTEGWYWDSNGWLYIIHGSQLRHVNPFTGQDDLVFDINNDFPGHDLWQAHSSRDGLYHNATVRKIVDSGPYPAIGTIVHGPDRQLFYPTKGTLDESQITTDRKYLLIKFNDDDNQVINLETNEERILLKSEGAMGHSDCGDSNVIGADRQNGCCALIDFNQPLRAGKCLFQSWNVGHISYKNNVCIVSDDKYISRVNPSGDINHIIEHGMIGSDYDHQVKANLTPDASYACYMSNYGSPRQDVYLVKI